MFVCCFQLTLFTNDSTVGQRLLDLEYRKVTDTTVTRLSRQQKVLFAAFSIIGPWVSQRAQTLAAMTAHIPHSNEVFLSSFYAVICCVLSIELYVILNNAQ